MDEPSASQSAALRVLQIISGALMAGVVSFGVAVLAMSAQAGAGVLPSTMVTYLSLGAVVLGVLASYLLPSKIVEQLLRKIAARAAPPIASAGTSPADYDLAQLLGVKTTAHVVGFALLEGPAFLGILAYLLERQALAFAAPTVALALMAVKFPTADRLADWLGEQRRRIDELRILPRR